MVDGTGMCGGCRVVVNQRSQFACVDGPEFDGHQVDYDGLMKRLRAYEEDEKREMIKIIIIALNRDLSLPGSGHTAGRRQRADHRDLDPRTAEPQADAAEK